jgi:soluble lytic murein transglycosylase
MAATKFTLPTGFENLQAREEARRKLADAYTQMGLEPQPGIRSWTQVLGQIGDALAGRHLEAQADKLSDQYNTALTNAYKTQSAQFDADVNSGMSPKDLVQKYSGNQLLADRLKPYADALDAGQKSGAEYTTFGGRVMPKSQAAVSGYDPGSPNDAVVRNPVTGKPEINPTKLVASQVSQLVPADATSANALLRSVGAAPIGVNPAGRAAIAATVAGRPFTAPNIESVESGGRDFLPNGQPVISPKGAMYGMQVTPSTAHNPGFGITPAANDSAAEYDRVGRDYAAAMLQRYNGNPTEAAAAYNAGPGAVDRALGMGGNFLSHLPAETQDYVKNFSQSQSSRAPDGNVNGKPYWMINGVPYDNPDGQ